MTNDEDRKELHELRSIVKSYEAFGGVNLLTAMAEMRRDVRELVEAVLATGGFLHREDDGCFSCTIDFEQLDKACRLAAKLKEQQ